MKRILIIDGGPRRNMSTAALCDAFAEGAKGFSPEIEVERVRLSYHDFSCTVPKKMPVAVLYTMNAPEQFLPMLDKQLGMGEQMLGNLGPVERVLAFNTYQVKDYSRYEFAPNTANTKQAYRDAHWESDLAAARAAGRRMAEKL